MRRLIAAAVFFTTLTSGVAHSADVMSDPAYDWTGFYSGVSLGYSEIDGTYFVNGFGNFDVSDDAIRFGTLSGYNFQSDNIVFGIESDTTMGTFKDSNAQVEKIRVTFESTLRARLGVSMDRLLPYVTAGAALAQASANNFGVGKDKNYHLGFVVGGGLEYAATDQIRLRAEYLYENYGKEKYDMGRLDDTLKWDQHIIRAAAIWAW